MDSQDKFVYESPDGGRTIYKRKTGGTERKMTEESLRQWNVFVEERKEDILWGEIRSAADEDAELAAMLKQIKTYYYLKHQSE